ncbi:tolloid-like protein 1 isoform X2 [Patiria miniata]|nr:tolloid-like protein 1 isoform X2 [Patiria miniata]
MEWGTKKPVFFQLSSSLSIVSTLFLLLCLHCCIVKACYQDRINLDSYSSETVITSLYYPDDYPPNLECDFYITAPVGQRVRIYFTSFTLEAGSTYSQCRFDYVKIFDGDSDADPVFGTFCGTNVPPAIVSSGEHLYAFFQSDGSVQEPGFRAVVHSVASNYREPLPSSSPGSCYSVLEEDYGNFYSPGYPGAYDHSEDCTFIIILPDENDHVLLRFTSFDLEPSQGCIYDYVEVRDGVSLATPLLGRFCGGFDNEPSGVMESTSRSMYVLFHTDISAAFEGFYAEYATSSVGFTPSTRNDDEESTISVCDISRAVITERGGFVVSNYHSDTTYDHHLRCSVQIIGSRSYERVHILFLNIDLPVSSSGCGGQLSDYIEVVDGQAGDNPTTLGTLCGNDEGRYTSSSPYAMIRFRTDGASNDGYTGFKALFSVFYEDAYGCEDSDFHCDNDRCIDPSLVCDGYDHCGDDSDEDKGCDGEGKDLTWLVILGIVAGCLFLILLGVCTACCFMNSKGTSSAPGSRTAATSRPTGNGTAVSVISTQNGMRQPYTYQNPVFSNAAMATAPPATGGQGRTEALPPKYSDIWRDPVNIAPPQGGAGGSHALPPAPVAANLYTQREMPDAAATAPMEASGGLAGPVPPPAQFQFTPPSSEGGVGMGGAEEPLGRAQVIRQPRGGTLPPLKGVQGRPADTT